MKRLGLGSVHVKQEESLLPKRFGGKTGMGFSVAIPPLETMT
jgi:hypothetical protein